MITVAGKEKNQKHNNANTDGVSQENTNAKTGYGIVDNRPESSSQKILQRIINKRAISSPPDKTELNPGNKKTIIQRVYDFTNMPLDEHESDINKAITQAKVIYPIVIDSLGRIQADAYCDEAEIYDAWFGSGSIDTVTGIYRNGQTWLDRDLIFHDIGDPSSVVGASGGTHAATIHQDLNISIFPTFYTTPLNVQAMTFIHEMTHLTDDTDDYDITATSPGDAKDLPDDQKINCAYNYECFADIIYRHIQEATVETSERDTEYEFEEDDESELIDDIFISNYTDATETVRLMIRAAIRCENNRSIPGKLRIKKKIIQLNSHLENMYYRDTRIGHWWSIYMNFNDRGIDELSNFNLAEMDTRLLDNLNSHDKKPTDETIGRLIADLRFLHSEQEVWVIDYERSMLELIESLELTTDV